jgi:hypothetical protein
MMIENSFDIICISCGEICETLWLPDHANWHRIICKCGKTNIEFRY